MTDTPLPDDICRCHDSQCQARGYCERWKQRDRGGKITHHAATLRPAWQTSSEPCDEAIGNFEAFLAEHEAKELAQRQP